MKKLFSFLRSMRFGLVLLVLILACSLVGSLLPQGSHTVFSSWYFIALMALLCLNLSFCSIARFRQACRAPKYAWGLYGSFLVHLSFLLILVIGALTLYVSKTEDHTVFPGHSLQLADGDVLSVESFRITDETGQLDFTSVIRVDSTDGTSSGSREISVNKPFSYKSTKYYQQSYGTAGAITAVNEETGGSDDFLLTEPVFLSADGRNGIWYEAVYPGYVRDAEGHFTLITSTEGAYTDPVYQVSTMSGGVMTPVLAFPGDVMEVNGLRFTFQTPVSYPGIRVKYASPILIGVLYGVFALMVVGLWLCFFHSPAAMRGNKQA